MGYDIKIRANRNSFWQTINEKGFNPAQELINNYKIAMESFIHEQEQMANHTLSPMEGKAHVYLKMAQDAASQLASYAYPKLKSMELSQSNQLNDMTKEQKIEMLKSALEQLEMPDDK